MNNTDYLALKQKYNRRIKFWSIFLFLIDAMILANAAITFLKLPYELPAMRFIIPDILFTYGFNGLKNAEIAFGIVLLLGFLVIAGVILMLGIYAFKHKRWGFAWVGLFVFADIPLLILVRDWQSILVHIALIAICIYGSHICGAIVQLEKKMWTF